MRISDWSSDVCSSDLEALWRSRRCPRGTPRISRRQARLSRRGPRLAPRHALPELSRAFPLPAVPRRIDVAVELLFAVVPPGLGPPLGRAARSEERRVGQEWVSAGRSRGSPYH